jgi:TRAP-type transport system periplasmic protein
LAHHLEISKGEVVKVSRLAPFLVASAIAAAPSAFAQTKWDLPAAYPPGNFHSENLVLFAADVEKMSGGKLKIQVHPSASLFKAPEIKPAVQRGQAQLGEVLLTNLENEDPIFAVSGVPFIATSYELSNKLYKASRSHLENRFNKQGMMLLYTVPWPPQGIYSKKPLANVADMKGVKWRSYSPVTAKLGELMGAQSVTIQAAELSQALATGVVESYISSGSTGFDSKTYEHVKYWYDTQAWLPHNAVIVNKAAFDALDKSTQEALLKAGAEAESRGWKVSAEKNGWYVDQLKQKGMTIAPPTPQFAAELRKLGETLAAEWAKKGGADAQAILEAYLKM